MRFPTIPERDANAAPEREASPRGGSRVDLVAQHESVPANDPAARR
jgi:hypothetical protein